MSSSYPMWKANFFFLPKILRTPPLGSFLTKLKPKIGLNILFHVHPVRHHHTFVSPKLLLSKTYHSNGKGREKKCRKVFLPTYLSSFLPSNLPSFLSLTLDVFFLLVLTFVPLELQDEDNFFKREEPFLKHGKNCLRRYIALATKKKSL